ncbi:phage scaffolding protein [Streptomyces sp. NRRL B-24720]|uniref:phage scaffolding protein n=1 Tax=Streptomyces sp. NRRL B-24720 TaxID=1476876 RepID=UPI000691F105|nr:phage scaffolding protein [Streptomyces sp. NRRL B-24720]
MNNHTDLTDTLPTRPAGISLPPKTVIGYVAGRPVYNIAGGAPDGDDTGGDDGEDGEDGDDTSGDGDDDDSDVEDEAPKPKPPAKPEAPAVEEFTPPSEAEWRKTQAALKKANEDAKRNRFRAKELEEKTRTNETEHEKALREAREEGESRFRAPLVKAAARAALSDAGVSGPADRVLRLLEMDGLSVDEDGDVVGLESEIDRIRSEYPEFFQAAVKPKPKARPTAADRKPAEEKPKSSAEQHAMRVLGRTG